MHRGVRRFGRPAAGLLLAGALVCLLAVPAVASGKGPIGKDQYFVGLVNGRTGQLHPVTIRTVCPSPAGSGQQGHPAPGQTVTVLRTSDTSTAGYTGSHTTIGAFFNAPPPAGDAASTASYVSFTRYGTQPIPTSVDVPCAGTGRVYFIPLPVTPPARDFVVPVRYLREP